MNQTEINVFDKLLYYLSHEGEVSWTKFKDAIDILTGKQRRFEYMSTYLKYLARLGHLDFDPKLSHVTIGPSVLLDTAVKNRYVLVGSRTPALLKEVENCVSDIGGKIRSESNQNAPATIIISDIDETSLTEFEKLGIHISLEFSAKLSQLLPQPKRSSFPPSDTPLSESRKKFNLRSLKFETFNQRQHGNGLYEIPQYGRNIYIYILKSGNDQRNVPRDWGIWLALSDAGKTSKLVYYRKKYYRWYVRAPLQIPLILDRCATLCSGIPPISVFRNKFYRYSYVHAGIAYQLTKSLNQNWEKVDVWSNENRSF